MVNDSKRIYSHVYTQRLIRFYYSTTFYFRYISRYIFFPAKLINWYIYIHISIIDCSYLTITVCVYLSISLEQFISFYLGILTSIDQLRSASTYLSMSISSYLSNYIRVIITLSVCQSVCPSLSLSIYIYVYI